MNRAIFRVVLLAGLAAASACNSDSTSPDATTTITVTDTFASRIQEKGSASRSFNVNTSGTVQVQLTSLSESGGLVRLGFGTFSGTTCTITRSIDTAADGQASAPQITVDVTSGDYCVQVSDYGKITTIVDFTVTISRPYTS